MIKLFSTKMQQPKQTGQVVLILLLVMLVALTVGLTITQRSISDVTNSTKNDQATRAFSAAEAGIEAALEQGESVPGTIPQTSLSNNSTYKVDTTQKLPAASPGYFQQALEFPKIDKQSIAQIWLSDPDTLAAYYQQPSFDVYFGNTPQSPTPPAIEINLITKDSFGNYSSTKTFADSINRSLSNNFNNCTQKNPSSINTIYSTSSNPNVTDRNFLCRVTISISPSLTAIMVRLRVLYSDNKEAVAVKPLGCTTSDCFLPPQARIYTSTGTSGQTQKTVQVFRIEKVVPPYFDYAIYSQADITK